MKNLFYFILLLPLFSLTGCKDDDNKPTNPIDQLPPATQTGANTFGCLINGEPFVVKNTSHQVAIYQGGILQVSGGLNTSDLSGEIGIVISEDMIGQTISPLQSYTLNDNNLMSGRYYKDNQNCFYFTNFTYNGVIKITKLDTINFIVSGNFEFQAITDCNNTEIINITNGRFDLQYIP